MCIRDRVNTLRIWDVAAIEEFGFDSFDKGDYKKAVEPVSYTHLDVYKRQALYIVTGGITRALRLRPFTDGGFLSCNKRLF